MPHILTKEQLIKIANEMYDDGARYSEAYSDREWEKKGWPEVTNDVVYKILDHQLRFMRVYDEYAGIEQKPGRKQKGIIKL